MGGKSGSRDKTTKFKPLTVTKAPNAPPPQPATSSNAGDKVNVGVADTDRRLPEWLVRAYDLAHPESHHRLALDSNLPAQAQSVAVRFLIARFHTALQSSWVGEGGEGLRPLQVVSADKVGRVGSGVWSVETKGTRDDPRGGPGREVIRWFLVIGETGDVIASSEDGQIESFGLREDWCGYLGSGVEGGDGDAGLMGRVRTKDVEGYPGGVARVWRGRVGEASEEVRVAERYVLSNVVLNR
jgi:hypothetical protein